MVSDRRSVSNLQKLEADFLFEMSNSGFVILCVFFYLFFLLSLSSLIKVHRKLYKTPFQKTVTVFDSELLAIYFGSVLQCSSSKSNKPF